MSCTSKHMLEPLYDLLVEEPGAKIELTDKERQVVGHILAACPMKFLLPWKHNLRKDFQGEIIFKIVEYKGMFVAYYKVPGQGYEHLSNSYDFESSCFMADQRAREEGYTLLDGFSK